MSLCLSTLKLYVLCEMFFFLNKDTFKQIVLCDHFSFIHHILKTHTNELNVQI